MVSKKKKGELKQTSLHQFFKTATPSPVRIPPVARRSVFEYRSLDRLLSFPIYLIVRYRCVTDALPMRYRCVTDALPMRYRCVTVRYRCVTDALPMRYRALPCVTVRYRRR